MRVISGDKPAAPLLDYRQSLMLCRELKHAWGFDPGRKSTWDGEQGVRFLYCHRCTTRRKDVFHLWRVDRRSYSYAKGYHVKSALKLDVTREVRKRLARLARNGRIQWLCRSAA